MPTRCGRQQAVTSIANLTRRIFLPRRAYLPPALRATSPQGGEARLREGPPPVGEGPSERREGDLEKPRHPGEIDLKPSGVTTGETKRGDFGHRSFGLESASWSPAAEPLSLDRANREDAVKCPRHRPAFDLLHVPIASQTGPAEDRLAHARPDMARPHRPQPPH